MITCSPEERKDLVNQIIQNDSQKSDGDNPGSGGEGEQYTTPTGTYALDDGTGLTTRYLSFSNGNFYDFRLKEGKEAVVLAEKYLWHCGVTDFENINSGDFSIQDGQLICAGVPYGAITVKADEITLEGEKFTKFGSFKSTWYTTLTVTGNEENYSYSRQTIEWTVSLDKTVPASVPVATSENDWLSGFTIADGKLSFLLSENNTGKAREGQVSVRCPGAESKIIEIAQSYSASEIVLSKSSQQTDYTGGTFSFEFSLNNLREGVTLTAESQNNWITDVLIDGNTVSYKVAENNSGSSRTGTIRLAYGGFSSAKYTVAQSYSASEIMLVSTSQQTDYKGGTFSFSFDVNNPRESTTISGQSQETWISNVSVKNNTVSYKVAENNSGAYRKGVLRLTYGNYATKDFTVSQSYTASVITLTPSSQSTDYTGGSFSFEYAVTNPRTTLTITAKSQATWITNVSIRGNVISYRVAENNYSARTGTILLSYGDVATQSFTVSQSYTASEIILSSSSQAIDGQQGGQFSFDYVVSNPRTNTVITAESQVDWISDVIISGNSVSYRVMENNSPIPRTGKIILSYGNFDTKEFYVNYSTDPTASNCYLISSYGTYSIKTVYGNSTVNIDGIVSAEVLWESYGNSTTPSVGSIIKNVSYSSNTITFSVPYSFKEGNAVIAAKDASSNILWSWHIWVCRYYPNSTAQVYYNNAGTMMDRNLGATTVRNDGSWGLLYQWGRKDPFLGRINYSSDTKAASTLSWPSPVSPTNSNGTIDYAVKNPTTLIGGNGNFYFLDYDWVYSSRDNTLWQSSKTIYDPCPSGWKVPTGGPSGVWSKATGSPLIHDNVNYYYHDWAYNGMNFSGSFGDASVIWYPAGAWWSCTPSGDGAYCFSIGSGSSSSSGMGQYGQSPSYRAGCRSVRCQKE